MLRPPPRDPDGLPAAPPLEVRVARWVTGIAALWFALAASWELFGPLLAGHYASSASMGIIAENMLRWRIAGPVWDYTQARPGPEAYYCHHPWGIFWTTAAFMKLLGRHDFVCRLPAVLLSIATPPLLHAIGRSLWRPAAGAAAAVGFVVLPITLAFASFNALEVPVIAWSLLAIWGFVRLAQTSRRRWLAVSLAGAALAMNADWPAFVLVAALLGLGLGRLFRGRLRPLELRRLAQWWALATSIAAGTVVLYLWLFRASGKLDDLLGSYAQRSSGNQAPLATVLASRRYWIELSFTPIAIALGKLAAIVIAVRALVLRRGDELLPLFVLAMATVQYVVFRQGADIHVFWPHYFGAYFALAMGALVATLAAVLERAGAWRAARRPGRAAPAPALAPLAALGVALLPAAAIARDGVPALAYARATGGRFNEKGLLIDSDGDKTAFLRFIEPSLPRDKIVDLHEGMKATWAQVWALGGRVVSANRAPPRAPASEGAPARPSDGRDTYLADTRFLLDDVQADLARRFKVTAVGPFWKIDRNEPAGPIEAFSFVEREPSPFEWYFVSGTEPHREVRADPFLTWELRTHFGQPAEPPADAPATLDQRRIAHNVAVAAGDAAGAASLEAEIRRELVPVGARFDDGTEVVGYRFDDGARPLLTIFVEAGGPAATDLQLAVRSKVLAPAFLSTTMADPTEREVGLPLAIAPLRWRAGFLYADPVPIRKRPGTEVFRASLAARGKGAVPRRVGGPPVVDLLTLR